MAMRSQPLATRARSWSISTLSLLGVLLSSSAYSQSTIWIDEFSSNAFDIVSDIAVDAQAIVIGGTIGPGAGRGLVRAYDPEGNQLWGYRYNQSEQQAITGVARYASDTFVVGTSATATRERAILGRHGANGLLLWLVLPIDRNATDVHVDASGMYVVGQQIDAQFHSGDGILRKHELDGDFVWETTFAIGGAFPRVTSLAADGESLYVTAGNDAAGSTGEFGILAKFSRDGVLLWSKNFEAYLTGVATSGGAVFAIARSHEAGTTSRGLLMKLSPEGEESWRQPIDPTTQPAVYQLVEPRAVAATDAGIFVTGHVDLGGVNKMSGFTQRYSPSGKLLWTEVFDGPHLDSGEAIALDESGVLVGGFRDSDALNPLQGTGFVMKVETGRFVRAGLDIRPGSCENLIRLRPDRHHGGGPGVGQLPVALIGSAELVAKDVDEATITLAGVAPHHRGRLHDITGTAPDDEACTCSTLGPDGLDDLILRFSTGEILEALGHVGPGETHHLTLSGRLRDGTPFEATDCISVVGHRPDEDGGATVWVPLASAWPNPFNPSTQIQFEALVETHVRISIFDAAGRRVERLLDEDRPAGHYAVNWDASSLASGVYFLRIELGDRVETSKLVLVK
jgi:hypothetical protein